MFVVSHFHHCRRLIVACMHTACRCDGSDVDVDTVHSQIIHSPRANMCRQCLHDVLPDRARFVSESGAYLSNYAGCTPCSAKQNSSNSNASTPNVMIKQPLAVTQRSVEAYLRISMNRSCSIRLLIVKSISCLFSLTEDNSATEVEDGEYEEIITYTRQSRHSSMHAPVNTVYFLRFGNRFDHIAQNA